jgi:hypothetical protein
MLSLKDSQLLAISINALSSLLNYTPYVAKEKSWIIYLSFNSEKSSSFRKEGQKMSVQQRALRQGNTGLIKPA